MRTEWRVWVGGSRDLPPRKAREVIFQALEEKVKSLRERGLEPIIVHGGARGADQVAKEFAILHDIMEEEFLPDYTRFGRNAPLIRNREMALACDEALFFWNGKSRGTAHSIELAMRERKPFQVIMIREE